MILRLLIGILLIASPSWAGFGMQMVSGGFVQSSAGDTCASDGLLLSWHAEDIDLANEDGCAVTGDTTFAVGGGSPTLSSDESSDGSTAVKATRNNYYTADISQNAALGRGTLWIDFRATGVDSGNMPIRLQEGATNNNRIGITFIGTDGAVDVRSANKSGGTAWATVAADTNITIANGYWYRVKYQYNTAAATTKQRIDVWQLDTGTPRQTTGSAISGTSTAAISDLGALSTIAVGYFEGVATGQYIYTDRVLWYATSDI